MHEGHHIIVAIHVITWSARAIRDIPNMVNEAASKYDDLSVEVTYGALGLNDGIVRELSKNAAGS